MCESDSNLRSPLVQKGHSDSRPWFTESKVPFKNSTNNRNLPCYSESKAAITSHIQNENINADFGKERNNISISHIKSTVQQSEFYGDRFIPCRKGSNMYEMQFAHDDNMHGTASLSALNSQNPE